MNSARSLICMAEHSAMLTPSMVADRAASFSREPAQSGQGASLTARSANARACAFIDSRSLPRYCRRTLGTRPS